jgi:hypothetical protein
MKVLGESMNGDVIMEMTKDEAKAFKWLQDAAAGLEWTQFHNAKPTGENLGPALIAVAAWAEAKFEANRLRGLVDKLDKVLAGPKEAGSKDEPPACGHKRAG